MTGDIAQLLHNMSVPPSSAVKYAGLATVAWGNRNSSRSCEVFGTAVNFHLSADLRRVSAASLLDAIGQERRGGESERHLLQLIEKRARELPIPDGAVVIPASPDHLSPWPDALAAIAVITKSSDNIWLRAKSPRLSVLRNRRAVSLLIPPAFASELEETRT